MSTDSGKSKLTLLDLIKRVGVENITVQPLERDLRSVNMSKKLKCALVTFGTLAITTGDIVTDNPKRKVGLILWMPKHLLPTV